MTKTYKLQNYFVDTRYSGKATIQWKKARTLSSVASDDTRKRTKFKLKKNVENGPK